MKVNPERAAACFRPLFIFTLSVIFIMLAVKPVFAGNADEPPVNAENRLYIMADEEVFGDYENIFVFFSNLELNGKINGSVYVFFSDITIGSDFVSNEPVRTFSSLVSWAQGLTAPEISPMTGLFSKTETLPDGITVFSDAIPRYAARLGVSLLMFIACFTAFAASRGFAGQGSVLLTAEPLRVIQNGLTAYFLFIALALVFALTVFLIPLTLVIALLFFLAMLPGVVSLCILIGFSAAARLKKPFTTAVYMAAGLIILTVIINIPFLNLGINLLFLPVLSLGIGVTNVINARLRRKFYYTPYKTAQKKQFDRERTRELLLGDKEK